MDEMKTFALWCIQEFPEVLLTPPISMFVAIALLLYVVKVIKRMMSI